MQITVYNPQKSRLETINTEFTKDNTTWFRNCRNIHDVSMITDIDGDILIGGFDYSYPFMITACRDPILILTREKQNSSDAVTNKIFQEDR
jgi:hypothetical protein